jgi:hypothetical protein
VSHFLKVSTRLLYVSQTLFFLSPDWYIVWDVELFRLAGLRILGPRIFPLFSLSIVLLLCLIVIKNEIVDSPEWFLAWSSSLGPRVWCRIASRLPSVPASAAQRSSTKSRSLHLQQTQYMYIILKHEIENGQGTGLDRKFYSTVGDWCVIIFNLLLEYQSRHSVSYCIGPTMLHNAYVHDTS